MVNKCPCCGSILLRPVLFALCPQRIFNYIWDNPGCTKLDLEKAIYGRELLSNVVFVHISKMRNRLHDTDYRIVQVSGKYTIVDVSMPSPMSKESTNASV